MQMPSYVVLPRGAHPSVAKFLALHLELFPILGLELLDAAGVSHLSVRFRFFFSISSSRSGVGKLSETLDGADTNGEHIRLFPVAQVFQIEPLLLFRRPPHSQARRG